MAAALHRGQRLLKWPFFYARTRTRVAKLTDSLHLCRVATTRRNSLELAQDRGYISDAMGSPLVSTTATVSLRTDDTNVHKELKTRQKSLHNIDI